MIRSRPLLLYPPALRVVEEKTVLFKVFPGKLQHLFTEKKGKDEFLDLTDRR